MLSILKKKSPPKIGIVFGSGGARGWAHVGVMRRLEELGIRPFCVAGTSIGSIAAASFITNRRLVLENVAEVADWRFMFNLFAEVGIPGSGMLKGYRVEDFLRKLLHPYDQIEKLPVPFAAVAADIRSTDEVVLSAGNLITAIRASVAIPGVFSPVHHDGRYLVDGGILNPVPVTAARSLGADYIIAVDVNLRCPADATLSGTAALEFNTRVLGWFDRLSEDFPQMAPAVKKVRKHFTASLERPSMAEILTQTMRIMENKTTASRLEEDKPDILIQPPVGHIQTLDFTCAKECIEAGYKTACECEALAALA